jgi:tRNA(Arg) A34 adenosine deaminase TadA
MCSGAVLLYGIPRVVIGENSTFVGEEDLLRSRGVQVVVLNDAQMMSDFIKEHPEVSTSFIHSWLAVRHLLLMVSAMGRHIYPKLRNEDIGKLTEAQR